MLASGITDLLSAGHPSDLVHPRVALHALDHGSSAAAADLLVNPEMHIREGRDLRQVRDAQHLVVSRQPGQRAPDPIGGAATDTRVHLIEDQHHPARIPAQRAANRKLHARELAPRSHLAQRAQRLTRVGAEAEDRRLGPVRTTRQIAWGHHRLETDLEAGLGHAQLAQFVLHALGQLACGPGTSLRQLAGAQGKLGDGSSPVGQQLCPALVRTFETLRANR